MFSAESAFVVVILPCTNNAVLVDKVGDAFIGYLSVTKLADSRKEMAYFLSTLVTLNGLNVTCDDSDLNCHILLPCFLFGGCASGSLVFIKTDVVWSAASEIMCLSALTE